MKTKMNYLTATLLAIFAWGGTGVGMAKQSKKVLRHPVEDNKKSPGVYDANQNDRQGIQDAEQGPGDKPGTWSISRPNVKNSLSEVTKGIYQIHGGGFPNITIIEGREGIMIIAPFVPKETMAESLDLYYRKAGKRPIKAVVDAHPHTNYFASTKRTASGLDIDGIEMEFMAVPGMGASSAALMYFPQFKALFYGEDTASAIHDICTLGVSKIRDAKNRWKALD